jgi:hypothetical protein
VDFRNAFDSVPWWPLFNLIERKRILNNKEAQLLRFIYSNICDSNGKNKQIRISMGTPQSMSTSPLLFEIYIGSILTALLAKGAEAYLFADDLKTFFFLFCIASCDKKVQWG